MNKRNIAYCNCYKNNYVSPHENDCGMKPVETTDEGYCSHCGYHPVYNYDASRNRRKYDFDVGRRKYIDGEMFLNVDETVLSYIWAEKSLRDKRKKRYI